MKKVKKIVVSGLAVCSAVLCVLGFSACEKTEFSGGFEYKLYTAGNYHNSYYNYEGELELCNCSEKDKKDGKCLPYDEKYHYNVAGEKYESGYYIVSGNFSEDTLTIPETYKGVQVVGIDGGAFKNNKNLKKVVLSKNIKDVKKYAFYGCENVTEFEVASGNSAYKAIDGNLYEQDEKTLTCYAAGKTEEEFVVGRSVETIDDGAFAGCDNLFRLDMSETSVETIGEGAFYHCSNLVEVELPNRLTEVGAYAFEYCQELEKIELPDSVEVLRMGAFAYCAKLETVELSANVRLLDDFMFYKCGRLETIILPAAVKSVGIDSFRDCSYLYRVEIGEQTEKIEAKAFDGCFRLVEVCDKSEKGVVGKNGLSGYELNVYTQSAGESKISLKDDYVIYDEHLLVEYCGHKNKIAIPNGVTTIRQKAFYNYCDTLWSIEIPESVTTIEDDSFKNCVTLKEVVIGENVALIGKAVFEGCIEFEKAYYKGTENEWKKIDVDSSNNNYLKSDTLYYYSENEPSLNDGGNAYDGNYWHYTVEGEIAVWKYEE